MCLVSTDRKHFQKVIANNQLIFSSFLCQGVSYPQLKKDDTHSRFMIRNSQRDRNLCGCKSETELMERGCGRGISVPASWKVFLPLAAVPAHLATSGDLEGSCGHKCVALLYTTKPTIFVSPGKKQEGEVEARNLWDNNKSINQLFYVKIINNKLVPLEQRIDFYRKHAKFYGIPVYEGYVVGKGGVVYTHIYFLKIIMPNFILDLPSQIYFPFTFYQQG